MIRILLLALAGTAVAADAPLIQPKDLAAQLKAGGKPVLLHVGFGSLYRGKRIPNSIYAGPGRDGAAALKPALAKLPKNAEIVIYCGCCPWDKCPNIKPALDALRAMGFTNVKALYIPTNMAKDWNEKGYPVELGPAAGGK